MMFDSYGANRITVNMQQKTGAAGATLLIASRSILTLPSAT